MTGGVTLSVSGLFENGNFSFLEMNE